MGKEIGDLEAEIARTVACRKKSSHLPSLLLRRATSTDSSNFWSVRLTERQDKNAQLKAKREELKGKLSGADP